MSAREQVELIMFVEDDGCNGTVLGGSPKRTPQCAKRMAIMRKLRRKVLTSTNRIDASKQLMAPMFDKQEALITHLVSLVKEADTGKGSESYGRKTQEAPGQPALKDRKHTDEED